MLNGRQGNTPGRYFVVRLQGMWELPVEGCPQGSLTEGWRSGSAPGSTAGRATNRGAPLRRVTRVLRAGGRRAGWAHLLARCDDDIQGGDHRAADDPGVGAE